jgi:hypothetical protein
MSTDPKSSSPPPPPSTARDRGKGMLIFTYPKVIFIFPTMIAALVCGVGMSLIHDDTTDPLRAGTTVQATESGQPARVEDGKSAEMTRFTSPQNLIGVLFLGVFAFNLLIMGLDFPRFTIIAIVLLALFGIFFTLWVGAYFNYDLMKPVRSLFGSIYAVANAGFYYTFATVLALMFVVIYVTRYLDYWEILPNEILHHHGPLSDLERFPTMNLKFDKEIPDVLEFLFLGAGRLVLHVQNERKSIVLDNVLFINSKEKALKNLMSRLEVRVTSDQEVAEP